MEVICPNCGNKFNWQPPEDTVVYKMLTSKDLKEKKKERYVTSCPNCKTKISIFV